MDVLFPVRCIECGAFHAPKDDPYLCRKCFNAIPLRNGLECIGCGRMTPKGITCPFCRKNWAVDQLLVAADYNNPAIQKLVKTLKYRFVPDASIPLCAIAEKYIGVLASRKNLNVFSGNPLVIPIPISKRRFLWRGFNQSQIIAEKLAARFGQESDAACLTRASGGRAQADVRKREERLQNVAGKFSCGSAEKISLRPVLLIDDICTTGATLNECAKILKANGASRVIALVVARESREQNPEKKH